VCGRFVAASPRDVLLDVFDVDVDHVGDELPLSYNVAPTDEVCTVIQEDDGRALSLLSWGIAGRINARAETLTERALFRDPFRRRRCLLPADGFYEWETLSDGSKQPWFFEPVGKGPLALAGIWNRASCAIVTTAAAEPVARLHDRMPVIVERDDWEAWLDSDASLADVEPLLLSPPTAPLQTRRVSPRVNNVRNNDPHLLHTAPPPPEPLALF
jgi:putative SOS response-associated peptidase YedK